METKNEVKEEYLLLGSKCLLCRIKYEDAANFKNISETIVCASKKNIKSVLLHLAKCIKEELSLDDGGFICNMCFEKITNYDQVMLNLLVCQRELTELLKKSINTPDDDDEEPAVKDESICGVSIEDQSENEDSESDDTNSDQIETVTDKLFSCAECGQEFRTKSSLDRHLSLHNKALKCHICGESRRDEEYLELHMNVHEGKSENECRYCPKRYSRKSNVIRHMHLHWDKKKYQCEKCGLRFSQANLLYNHKMHHEAEEQPLVCSICEQTFKSKKTLRHHMVTHREDRPMYPCEICGKKFTERYTLKMHLKIHIEDDAEPTNSSHVGQKKKGKQYTCIICDEHFWNKDSLDSHMTEKHDVIKEFF